MWFISSICQSPPCRMGITFQNTRLFWVSLCFIRHSSVSFASSSFSSWSLDHSVPQGSVIHTFLYQRTLSPWWSHPVSCYYIPSICWQFPDLYFLDFSPELQTHISIAHLTSPLIRLKLISNFTCSMVHFWSSSQKIHHSWLSSSQLMAALSILSSHKTWVILYDSFSVILHL